MGTSISWSDKIQAYCKQYNLPLEYLAEVLHEPKVVPMIRGKAFEFSVFLRLKELLGDTAWEVTKVPMNAQTGYHDVDVLVANRRTGKRVRIECKLAAKGRFTSREAGDSIIQVKCMRSRTLGRAMATRLAPKLGVSLRQLLVHNDQYQPTDFDIVITSIGNAFYKTNTANGKFEWSPTEPGIDFLRSLQYTGDNLQDFSFSRMYVAVASQLAVSSRNDVVCTRKKCQDRHNCGFIPNYPKIIFRTGSFQPAFTWIPVEDIETVLLSLTA